MRVTEDRFLGGRLLLCQPAKGFRAGSDSVLLAAAVPAVSGETALDLGCGVGAGALCLAARVAGVRVVGLDLQSEMVELARQNAAHNNLEMQAEFHVGDVADPPAALAPDSFDHVFANPPYFQTDRSNRPADPSRALARTDVSGQLAAWVRCMIVMARPGGSLTVIHRSERLAELTDLLADGAGDIAVLPLLAHADRPAKRAIVRATKWVRARTGARGEPRHLPGLVLHRPDGAYTDELEAILRGGGPLRLRS